MRLLVIRHGESEADILHLHEGRADFELTERGHRQTDATGIYISGHYKLDRIYHSTLKRAAQTAQHIADHTGAPLFPEDMLREHDNGLRAGLPYEEGWKKYPYVDYDKLPIHTALYEEESRLDFRYRAEFILSKIISENDAESTVAVVCHGGTIHQLYKAFLRLPIDAKVYFRSGDACIHEWETEGNSRSIIRANFCPHGE